MPRSEISLVVVGAQYPNSGKRGAPGPNRMFEILVSQPGDTIDLRAEPTNPADPNAIAIYSCRGIQIGYVAADRTNLIRHAWHAGKVVRAIFQRATADGAIVRVNLDGEIPSLPLPPDPVIAPDDCGWPEPEHDGVDWIPPDE